MRGVEVLLSWLWVAGALLAFLLQFQSVVAPVLALVGLR